MCCVTSAFSGCSWASVAPPLRWSRPSTVAFLLPSRAAAGFPTVLRPLAGLALAALAQRACANGRSMLTTTTSTLLFFVSWTGVEALPISPWNGPDMTVIVLAKP